MTDSDEETIIGDDMDLYFESVLSDFDDELSGPWSGDSDSDLEDDD